MADIEKINKTLFSFCNGLDRLEKQMEPLFEHGSVDEVEKRVAPVESAKLNTALAYSLNSLYFSNFAWSNIQPT